MAKRIIILGAGESGTGAALLARSRGLAVFVSDNGTIANHYRVALTEAGIPFEEGGHSGDLAAHATEVIKSPGIPDDADIVRSFSERGIPVISELEFASRYTHAKLIAITGTNGKTTTTLLTHHILKSAGLKVGLAGNVGYSLARQVMEDPCDYYVVEVSSFQLDGMFKFKADIAVLLNITKDHLNRYHYNFDEYIASKFRITQNMKDHDSLIYFADDPVITSELSRQQLEAAKFAVSLVHYQKAGAYVEGENLRFNLKRNSDGHCEIALSDLSIKGPHNMVNAMAASLAALLCGVPLDQLVTALGSFRNVPHRLEHAGTIRGAIYINDSKATNVDAVFYALRSFEDPIIWIAGGIDKGNNYALIEELVASRVKAIICLGVDNRPLLEAFAHVVPEVREVNSMEGAIEAAMGLSAPGDIVLLSPACASFDLFRNYQDRGDQFKQVVASKKKVSATKVLMR